MKAGILVAVVVLLSAAASLFAVMHYLTYGDDRENRTESMNPELSSFGENTYIVWQEAKDSEFFDVYFQKIKEGNLSDDPVSLTDGNSFYPRPQVLASENNVYVLWEDRTDKHGFDGDTVFFKKSNDHGKTFDETVSLGPSDVDQISYTPIAMEVANGILYVFMFQWDPDTDEKTIVLMSSHDHGSTFGSPEPFFQFDKKWASLFDVTSVDGTIYAVSADSHGHSDESGKISFRKILPDEKTTDVTGLSKTGIFVNSLKLAVSGEKVYVVSAEISEERNDSDGTVREKGALYLTKSNDRGNTFEKPKKINKDSESSGVSSHETHVLAYGDSVYVAWEEKHYDDESQDWHRKKWFANSDNSGNAFEVIAIHPLDDLRSKKGHMDSFEENKALYFVVTAQTGSPDADNAIYFARSDDGGRTVPKMIDVVGNPVPVPYKPKVSMAGNYIHIVTDTVPDRNCILHVSSSNAGESFSQPANLSPNGSLEDCFAR